MFGEALSATLCQLLIFVAAVYAAGFLISLMNRAFYGVTGRGRAVCLATGLIGTPIHELSHAVACLLFFHKITEMRLYQTDDENGVLGYVRHSYNPKNIYQRIGNYFIGVAPILCGGACFYLMMRWLLPSAFDAASACLSDFAAVAGEGFSASLFSEFFSAAAGTARAVFTVDFGYRTVIFLLFCACVALHMNLSGADIKGSLSALPLLAVGLFAANFALLAVSESAFSEFGAFMTAAGGYLITSLLFGLLFSLALLIIGWLVKIIFSVVLKK